VVQRNLTLSYCVVGIGLMESTAGNSVTIRGWRYLNKSSRVVSFGKRSAVQSPSSGAHVAQNATAAAILGVLKLNDQAVRVGKVQFGCSFLRPAAILHAHADVVH